MASVSDLMSLLGCHAGLPGRARNRRVPLAKRSNSATEAEAAASAWVEQVHGPADGPVPNRSSSMLLYLLQVKNTWSGGWLLTSHHRKSIAFPMANMPSKEH